jgi:TrmH family RNA methyltransferase
MTARVWNWRIVLVRPRNPLNIGAAARAMANFGFRDLRVVNPYESAWQETQSAVGAEDVVRGARSVPSLIEAVDDVGLVVGTTSGSRRHLTRELVALTDLPAWLAAGRRRARSKSASRGFKPARTKQAALLFGSEKTGLSNEEMSYCQLLVRIPTSPACPSMNLGQAVAVCCYELARQGLVSNPASVTRLHSSDPATQQSLAHLFDRAARVLDAIGYTKPNSRAATLRKLREFLLAMCLTNYDARILGGVLAQIEWKLGLAAGSSGRRASANC